MQRGEAFVHALRQQLRIYANPRELPSRFLESDVICAMGMETLCRAARRGRGIVPLNDTIMEC